MPELPACAAPVPSTGKSFSVWTVTLWLKSPLSVFSSAASALTVTDSLTSPTSSLTSMRKTCATETVMPVRTNFLKPDTATDTSYEPGGNCAIV